MTQSNSRVSTLQLIAVPSLITLAITILRLVGELQHWSETFFSTKAGGGSAVVGISWLPLLIGIYFAFKLADGGQGPSSRGAAIGYSLLALPVIALAGTLVFALNFPGHQLLGLLVIAVAIFVPMRGWPELFKVLLAYAYAARIPVAIVMYFALQGNWGTHYDATPPNFPADVAFWSKYFQIGLLPQLLFWIAYTVVVGSIFGSVAVAIFHKGRTASHTAATA
jgi:hypothetical protein